MSPWTLRLDVALLTVLDLPRPNLPPTVARPPETLGRDKPGHCGIVRDADARGPRTPNARIGDANAEHCTGA